MYFEKVLKVNRRFEGTIGVVGDFEVYEGVRIEIEDNSEVVVENLNVT